MGNIKYTVLLVCCVLSSIIHAADAQEPLLHSVPSEVPSVEGGVRMLCVAVDGPDAVEVDASRPKFFSFDASATGTIVHATRPKPSPRSGNGVLTSPKSKIAQSPRGSGSRRNSKGSYDSDEERRVFVTNMCSVAGKYTGSTKQHFRRLYAQKIVASKTALDRSDTTIDGDSFAGEQFIDSAVLNAQSREGSAAAHDDVAQGSWIPTKSFEDIQLTAERIAYLKKLKKAANYYKAGLESFSDSYALAQDKDKDAAVRTKLADIFHEYYGTGTLHDELMDAEHNLVDRDLQQADQLGCCAGCCVIL